MILILTAEKSIKMEKNPTWMIKDVKKISSIRMGIQMNNNEIKHNGVLISKFQNIGSKIPFIVKRKLKKAYISW